MRGKAIRRVLSLRRAFQNWGERVVGRRGAVLMDIITDYPVNSKLPCSLVAKESTSTLQLGQSSTATPSVAKEDITGLSQESLEDASICT
jgi:hypothetical protein